MKRSIKLLSRHRFTVPAEIVRELKLQAGDRLTCTAKDGTIIFRKVT